MAAIYTEADRQAVKDAIIDLATGKRTVMLSIAGRMKQYAVSDLAALKGLLSDINAEIGDARGERRVRTIHTTKGF